MSITPTAVIPSALSRPDAGLQAYVPASTRSIGSLSAVVGSWVCCDHMSTEHNPTTGNPFGSKRLDPGSFAGDLT
jgi:hypothetical protein